LDCTLGRTLARFAGGVRQLEQLIQALSAVGQKRRLGESLFNALLDNPDFEYLIIDSTIVRAHQHAAGAKGGAKMKRSGVRAAA
jgi:hypothetical protein